MAKQVNKYLSTKVPEKYFHLNKGSDTLPRATVFMRKEGGAEGRWLATAVVCSPSDNFSKSSGRTKSRRRWFEGYARVQRRAGTWLSQEDDIISVKEPTFTYAMAAFEKVYNRRRGR